MYGLQQFLREEFVGDAAQRVKVVLWGFSEDFTKIRAQRVLPGLQNRKPGYAIYLVAKAANERWNTRQHAYCSHY